jgi:ABC-type branched-subunit amino acid transport system ATPase component
MSRPVLLAVRRLCVRFGGLWALQNVDLEVAAGEVVAVIGPNGAGKTTLFNVISGIYAPTSGALDFNGAPLQRPWRLRHAMACAALAVCVGVMALLLAANVDRMWAVVIKQNTHPSADGTLQPFDVSAAWHSWVDYMRGAPHVEARMGRLHVVSADGTTTYGSTRDTAEAAALLAQAQTASAPAQRGVQLGRLAALGAGCAMGAAGAWAVWRQGRRTATWIAQQGIARTFQNNRLFSTMRVRENVEVGLDRHHAVPWGRGVVGLWTAVALWAICVAGLRWQLWPQAVCAWALGGSLLLVVVSVVQWLHWGAFGPALRRLEGQRVAEAASWLQFVGLEAKAEIEAASLSYGHQRRLEIARALATRPRLLLLDEPAAGMNPTETAELMELIGRIKARGIAVLLIEHDMRLIMGISDRVAVLEYGRQIACGSPHEVRHDPRVIAAYLGEDTQAPTTAKEG